MTPPSDAVHSRSGSPLRLWSAWMVIVVCLWASGAPTVLYPLYSDRMGLAPVAITVLFAAYPVALMAMLIVVGGGFANVVGPRRAMIAGCAAVFAGSIVFAFAPGFALLLVGRIVQGIGVGMALAAASATVVQEARARREGAGSGLTTMAVATGLVSAMALGGIIVQLVPAPEIAAHLVLAAACAVTLMLLGALAPDAVSGARWRPGFPRVPRSLAFPVVRAVLGVVVAFVGGAVFMAFAAKIARDLVVGGDMIVVGALLGLSSVVIAVSGLVVDRFSPRTALVIGSATSIVSVVAMGSAVLSGSLALFLVWCVVGGVGYAFAFAAGIAFAQTAGAAEGRANVLSLVYVISYFAQTVAAVAVGAVISAWGMQGSMVGLMAGLGLFFVVALLVALRGKPRRLPGGIG